MSEPLGLGQALDPDVAAFRDADSDAARAAILLAAPVSTLMRWKETFERSCRTVEFGDGLAYLAALAAAQKTRRHRGAYGTTALDGARQALLSLADSIPRPRTGHWREPYEAPASPHGDPARPDRPAAGEGGVEP